MRRGRGNVRPVAGTAREQRFPQALAPEYAPVDERTCAEQMAFALEFSRLLVYYDDSNQPSGTWLPFFERDLSFLLARIITTDFRAEHYRSSALQRAAREGRVDTREILKAIYQVASRLDHWYRWAAHIAEKDLADNRLRMTLQSIIQTDLSQYLGANIDDILKKLPLASGEETWSTYWKRRESQLDETWRNVPPDIALFAPTPHADPVDGLLAILRAMHQANHRLRDVATSYLEQELNHRSNHPPHTTLYIAFAKLLDMLRGRINTLTGRHLDFYYRDVLGLAERGSSPDHAHLSFALAPQVDEYLLPAGTRLAAGKGPDGSVREYATDADLFINQARIESIKSVYLVRDHLQTSSHAPQRVMNVLALPVCNSEDGNGAPLVNPAQGWPTFGVSEVQSESNGRLQLNAELGFIVASPVLLLEEGERHVTISIAFAGEDSFGAALQAYRNAAGDLLDQPAPIELLLADAFQLSLSGEKGWMAVTRASYRRHPVVGTNMEIEFTLPASNLPIVANPALAPEPQRAQWPMLKLALNPLARIFAYSFFKDLMVQTIDIRVNVRGAKKMQLRNDAGLLSSAQPFSVFSPVPVQGSYLLLSHPELTVKQVDHVAIVLTWFNLPKPPSSLASYYEAYNLGISDESFKIRLSVSQPGRWIAPSAGHDLFPLFARDFERSGVLPTTAMAVDIPELAKPPAAPPGPELLTETRAPRGCIRLELVEPEFAFGHNVFPRIMADAAAANA
ncbi:MAG TPA: hypothetical protein VFY05_14820, partial [Candidatus Angelobacter sp.]|nr:hypothetical protein [Candidatus Angelobacter sp.]